jgi:enterochelin esterase-like enzyme
MSRRSTLFGLLLASCLLIAGGVAAVALGASGKHRHPAKSKIGLVATTSTTSTSTTSTTTTPSGSNEDAAHEANESAAVEAQENATGHGAGGSGGTFTPNEDATHEQGESAAREAQEDAGQRPTVP